MKVWDNRRNDAEAPEWDMTPEEIARGFMDSEYESYPWPLARAVPVYLAYVANAAFDPDDEASQKDLAVARRLIGEMRSKKST